MRMIYYLPAPIQENATSASGIRPKKMLEAFRSLGYQVDVVAGYNDQRKKAMQQVKENVAKGIKYDFAYGEDTTQPFVFNDPKHFPPHLLMDYAFWRFLHFQGIPFGCFYRDMYWRFPEFKLDKPFYKRLAHQLFHNIDIMLLKKYCTKIFLPTAECAEDLPIEFHESQIESLPPGGDEIKARETIFVREGQINLFYVGGFVPPNYDLNPIINFVAGTDLPVMLTICCRSDEYMQAIKDKIYPNIISDKIKIIHESGVALQEYWEGTDIFAMAWNKMRYHKKGMPVKTFESIGNAIPIIITRDSAAANLVERENFGWAIEPTKEAIEKQFAEIIENPQLLVEKKKSLLEKRHAHTWKVRAKYVVETLIGGL